MRVKQREKVKGKKLRNNKGGKQRRMRGIKVRRNSSCKIYLFFIIIFKSFISHCSATITGADTTGHLISV